MRRMILVFGLFLLMPTFIDAAPPSREDVEALMGLPSEGDLVRGQLDTVGFIHTRAQAEDLFSRLPAIPTDLPAGSLLGGICPHDDHLYSARVMMELTQRITAPRVILFGVFHKARLWDLEGKLVFDSFEAWHAPSGPVRVDDASRSFLEGALPKEDYLRSNTMHCREHSIESIVPFLQHRNPEVEIIPILVPYLRWAELEKLADDFSSALSALLKQRHWELGRDIQIVISSDAVHYGPDFEHAPFGTGIEAYQQATERDRELINSYLSGPLAAPSLHRLLGILVDEDNPRSYRIPWCGRFSIPFGMEVLRRTSLGQGIGDPEGRLLRYGSSLEGPQPELSEATRRAGLGLTAPANLHHWVGFFSLAVLKAQEVR